MMFFLYHWRGTYSVLNVFHYITFRAIAAAMTSFLISLMFGNYVIRRLIGLKAGQPIRTKEQVRELAALHGGKAGTPTMGGVLLLGSVIISTLLWARLTNPSIWLALFTIVYLGMLGFVDDYLKVTKKKSDGVHARVKMVAQLVLAAVVTAYFLLDPATQVQARALYVPFYKEPVIVNLGYATFFFFALVVVGTSNAVNLTDGLDGLATGCTVTAALAFAVLAYVAGNVKFSSYLQVPFYPYTGELSVVSRYLTTLV